METSQMRICFAIENFDGLESIVSENVRTAKGIVIADTFAKSIDEIPGTIHDNGNWEIWPQLKNLGVPLIDAFVVGDIGAVALIKLVRESVRVYCGVHDTVGQNIVLMLQKKLPEFRADFVDSSFLGKTA